MKRDQILEKVSEITEFNDLHKFMQDSELDYLLGSVVRLMAMEDLAPDKAAIAIVQLQAHSAKMGILASYYSNIEKGRAGSDEAKKKNIYYSMRDNIDRVVDALKIYVRYA